MPSTRRKAIVDITQDNKKKITRHATCIDLFAGHEITFCCDTCKPKIDVCANKRKKKKSNEELTLRNQYQQPWLASHGNISARLLFHKKACDYLNYSSELNISCENLHHKNSKQRNTKHASEGKDSEAEKPSQHSSSSASSNTLASLS